MVVDVREMDAESFIRDSTGCRYFVALIPCTFNYILIVIDISVIHASGIGRYFWVLNVYFTL